MVAPDGCHGMIALERMFPATNAGSSSCSRLPQPREPPNEQPESEPGPADPKPGSEARPAEPEPGQEARPAAAGWRAKARPAAAGSGPEPESRSGSLVRDPS